MDLSDAERATLRLLADTIIPRTGDPSEPLGGSASDLGIDELAARAIRDYQPPDIQRQFRRLLRAVENPALNLLLTGRPVRFSDLTADARETYLLAWSRSRLPIKRRGFHSIKRLISFLYYSALTDDGGNPAWPALGYPPPNDGERGSPRTPPEPVPPPVAGGRETTIQIAPAVV